MAEGARLESVYTFARIEGSNPSLTAKLQRNTISINIKRLNSKGIKPFLMPYAKKCNNMQSLV